MGWMVYGFLPLNSKVFFCFIYIVDMGFSGNVGVKLHISFEICVIALLDSFLLRPYLLSRMGSNSFISSWNFQKRDIAIQIHGTAIKGIVELLTFYGKLTSNC